MHIETFINKTQDEERSYIYIRTLGRSNFPRIGKDFDLVDSKTNNIYTVHLEGSYRITGLGDFFTSHPKIRENTKIIITIDIVDDNKLYEIHVDSI